MSRGAVSSAGEPRRTVSLAGDPRPTILLAGGGTGGHVFPAVAVAEALQALAEVDVVFCGTARGIEARVVPARGWPLELLRVEPLKGRGPAGVARGLWVALRASANGLKVVRRRRPRAVLGVGGYASGPVVLAAAACGVPVALFEPNFVAGLSNRLLAPLARRAYVAWEETAAAFPRRSRRVFGVPLRKGFGPQPYVAGGGARVLVLGGSQGAAPLNERMPAAIARAKADVPALEVLHQSGRDRDGAVREAYARAGVDRARVVPFVEDVAGAIAEADLVVARSGAGTIAEVTAVGRASILVPFPLAADDHQARNAEALERSGGAVALRQDAADAPALAAMLRALLLDGPRRTSMADAARARGRPDAARAVAVDLLALARISGRTDGPPTARAVREREVS